ncbi:hypothetical protein GHT06_008391 [Daphnia sinensis]|uniref:F-box domain-containing protein n=1 Tax=Daphnia sinensis TaxID=1820382 RepID=A0AAD5LMB7_9CRUS|nr:hypothetical protein GHT06_008391 [Daphnia sinensis]
MDTAVSPIDIPLLPTPSTSSASPSVELRHDFEVLSSNATDFSSAHTSPDDFRNSQIKECDVICPEPKSVIADSLKIPQRKQPRTCPVVYESQISPELEGIKLKIKKSPTQEVLHQNTSTAAAGPKSRAKKSVRLKTPRVRKPAASAGAKSRKRKRRKKGQSDDGSDENEEDQYDFVHINGSSAVAVNDNSGAQSIWANERMPPEILSKIFMEVTYTEGCVPTLVRLSRVCRLWWKVSTGPLLWHTVDLATGRVKEKHRTEGKLLWLLRNRLSRVQDLALGGWNSALSRAAVEDLSRTCNDLKALSLTGCKGLMGDSLLNVIQNCKSLQKLDLSAISPYTANPRGAISSGTLCELTKIMGSRLSHLNLANNCTTGIQQIVVALAVSCPNLQVLDLSNTRTATRDTVCINIEQLQEGCPKLRVLRLTNSLIRLSATPLKDQAASLGFPHLEELSIAVDPKAYISLDNASIERILKNAHKLRLLDVRGCTSITNSSLVRVPAWDLEHLFLSGCTATRHSADGLELVVRKWRHSLVEIDLSWTSVSEALDQAVMALAEDPESPLKVLDLCGSSVSFPPIRQVLCHCTRLRTLNLSSCRALPRGIKRLYDGVTQLSLLRTAIQAGRFDDNNDQADD